jgi:hypothetical protein
MVDVQTISIAVASAGVFVAAMYYVLLLRHQSKVRQTELVTRLYSTFASEGFQKEWFTFMEEETDDYKTYRKKYGVEIPPTALFFNEIGILLGKKLIDIDLVYSLFGTVIKRYWERARPLLESGRKMFNQPRWGWGLEYLHNEMKRREQTLQQSIEQKFQESRA